MHLPHFIPFTLRHNYKQLKRKNKVKYLNILFVLVSVLLFGCKDSLTQYAPPPVKTVTLKSVELNSVVVSGNVLRQGTYHRGFIISKTPKTTIENPEATLVYTEDGFGTFSQTVVLEPNTTYWISAFAYFPGQADNIGYGNAIVFQTK